MAHSFIAVAQSPSHRRNQANAQSRKQNRIVGGLRACMLARLRLLESVHVSSIWGAVVPDPPISCARTVAWPMAAADRGACTLSRAGAVHHRLQPSERD